MYLSRNTLLTELIRADGMIFPANGVPVEGSMIGVVSRRSHLVGSQLPELSLCRR